MIIAYVLRSLIARARATLSTVLVIAATTAAITIVLGLSSGLRWAIAGHSPADLAVVVGKGGSDFNSEIANEVLAQLRVSPAIAMQDGKAMVSAELTSAFPVRLPNDALDNVRVRGIDPIAFSVHEGVKASTTLETGARKAIIGARLVGRYENMVVGGTMRIGRHKWDIVGTMTAPGQSAESEVWVDRTALQDEIGATNASIAYVKLASPDRIAEIKTTLEHMRDQQVEILSANALRARTLSEASIYLDAIGIIVAVLCISAVFAGTNATYAMYLGQMRELGTLMAIGFTRIRVSLIVLVQSLLLALSGALAGLGLAMLANGYTFVFHELMLVYEVRIGPDVLVAGLAAASVIGIVGSLMAVVQTYKLNVLTVLRD